MIWLGLLLPNVFIVGVTGASVPTQWAFLSLALPLALWQKKIPPGFLPGLGLCFLAFSALSLTWAPQRMDSAYGLWCVALWGLSFLLGYASDSQRQLWQGLSLGLTVSTIIAILQVLGYTPVMSLNANISGLLFNRTVLGAACGLVILACVEERLWWYIPAPALALALSNSRGGFAIVAFGIAMRFHWLLGTALLASALLAIYFFDTGTSDAERLQIWGVALQGITLRGWATGSFSTIYYLLPSGRLVHPEFVHNDYLQLAFEFGAMALVPISFLFSALYWRPTATLWGFALLMGFYFPLYAPVSAFIGCFIVGHALRGFSLHGAIVRHCRPDIVPWVDLPTPRFSLGRRSHVPIQPRTTN